MLAKKDNFNWRKRINIVLSVIFLLMLLLSIRIFQKSVLEHNKYKALAEDQQKVQQEIPALRGKIFAQDKTSGENYPLATSIQKYSVNVVPKNIKNPGEVAAKLAPILNMEEKEIFEKINNQKLYIPPLKKALEKETADQITNLNITGITLSAEEYRFYPEGSLASQVLGFVNAEGKGNYGLEGYYNSELVGQKGMMIANKDAEGEIVSPNTGQDSQNGSDLILSIDHNVQYFVEQKLAESKDKYQADEATAIIMDPKTGAILAMASNPTYDSNKYNEVPQDNQKIFMNPAVSYVWEPGSIYKAICMGAALNEKKVEPDTKGTFSNMAVVDGYEIHTAQDKAFGEETMTQVLENSDNVAMIWVADQLGDETYYNYIKKFGFGEKTGIDVDGEVIGSLLEAKKWRNVNRANFSFGQGLSVTPLQMVTGYAAIANGGKVVKPYLVEKIIKPDGKEVITPAQTVREAISQESAAKLTEMLVSVVDNGHGKKAQVSGFKVAGKTGTAQVPNPSGGYYEDRHVGSFAGFFPADNPKFAMIVKLDNPKNVEWAESSAAPTFGEIAAWLLNYYEIAPNQ